MDHPDITRGWWDIEHDGPMMSRWTDGAAVLPLPPMRGPVMLEIHLAGTMTFLEDAVAVGGIITRFVQNRTLALCIPSFPCRDCHATKELN